MYLCLLLKGFFSIKVGKFLFLINSLLILIGFKGLFILICDFSPLYILLFRSDLFLLHLGSSVDLLSFIFKVFLVKLFKYDDLFDLKFSFDFDRLQRSDLFLLHLGSSVDLLSFIFKVKYRP